jgi:hypothetical protein
MSNQDRDQLVRELHDRSHDIGGHPIGLDDVKQSARRIRRRRTAVTGAVAALAAVVAVPAGVALIGTPTTTDEPDDTNIATPAPTPAPGPTRLTLQGLERGEAPQVPYLERGRLVTPDGSQPRPLPANVQSITPYGDGWLGVGYDGQGAELYVLDADLTVTERIPTNDASSLAADGAQVAFVRVEDDGSQTLTLASSADGTVTDTWSFPRRPVVTPTGFLDGGRVTYQTEGRETESHIIGPDGDRSVDAIFHGTIASPAAGLIAGTTSVDELEPGSCSAVFDPSDLGRPLWETCEYSLVAFSPDGRFLLATDAWLDGLGQRSLAILDARTGQVFSSLEQPRNGRVTLTNYAWEGLDSAVAVATDDVRTWTIVRLDVSGEVTEAIDPVETSSSEDFPLWLGQP